MNLLFNLRLIPVLRGGPRPSRSPLVSVIIPARNEQREIEETVRRLLAQTWRDIEVIVVDDRSSDDTAAVVKSLALTDERLILVEGDELPEGWLGKPWALAQGAGVATGELLLFVDADVCYEPEVIASMLAFRETSGCAVISVFPHVEMKGFWENVLMPQLAILGFVLMPTWLANRTQIPKLAVGGGPGNLLDRADYMRIGGHHALRNAVIDDVGLVRLARRNNLSSMVCSADTLIHLRMYRGGREVIEGFTKNAFISLGGSLLVSAFVQLAILVVHLLPYYWAVRGLLEVSVGSHLTRIALLGIISVALITVARVILFRRLRYSAIAAVVGHPLMMAGWGWITARSTWIGFFRKRVEWRGRGYDSRLTRFGGE